MGGKSVSMQRPANWSGVFFVGKPVERPGVEPGKTEWKVRLGTHAPHHKEFGSRGLARFGEGSKVLRIESDGSVDLNLADRSGCHQLIEFSLTHGQIGRTLFALPKLAWGGICLHLIGSRKAVKKPASTSLRLVPLEGRVRTKSLFSVICPNLSDASLRRDC